MTQIPAHIELAAILVDNLHYQGYLSVEAAQALFDVVADGLAVHPDVVNEALQDINLIKQAFTNVPLEGDY